MNPKPTIREYLGISLFWFAISFFWGAMLVMVLPDHVQQLVGAQDKDRVLTIVSSVGAFVATGTQILFGALSDGSRSRFGRRRPFLCIGTVLTTGALLVFPAAHSLIALVGAYIAIQFFLNVANGPYQALLPDRIPFAYHGTASAYMGVATLLGRIGGPAAAVITLGKNKPDGLLHLMIVFAVLLNAFMLVNLVLIQETPLTDEGPSVPETLRNLFNVSLRPYPSLVWLLISRFGIMMGVYTVTFCLFYYIQDTLGQHDEASKVLLNFMLISTVTGIIGTLPAGKISDKYSKKLVLYISNTIGILAGLGFMSAHHLPAAYVAVAVFGIGYGAFSAVDWALVCNLLPMEQPAKYMGVWSISDTLPQIIAPLIAGPIAYVINHHSSGGEGYRVLMGVSMIYFFLGTLALRFIQERPAEVAELAAGH